LAAEKLPIGLANMRPDVEISELCRREGINPTQYYTWKKQLLPVGRVFNEHDRKPDDSKGGRPNCDG